jgi:hypothetical protein
VVRRAGAGGEQLGGEVDVAGEALDARLLHLHGPLVDVAAEGDRHGRGAEVGEGHDDRHVVVVAKALLGHLHVVVDDVVDAVERVHLAVGGDLPQGARLVLVGEGEHPVHHHARVGGTDLGAHRGVHPLDVGQRPAHRRGRHVGLPRVGHPALVDVVAGGLAHHAVQVGPLDRTLHAGHGRDIGDGDDVPADVLGPDDPRLTDALAGAHVGGDEVVLLEQRGAVARDDHVEHGVVGADPLAVAPLHLGHEGAERGEQGDGVEVVADDARTVPVVLDDLGLPRGTHAEVRPEHLPTQLSGPHEG